jgi:hypothetical protein
MKFGYFTLSDNRYPNNPRSPEQFLVEIRDQAVLAEKLGLNSAWIGEHHFNRRGCVSVPAVVLANIAASTTRLRLGPAVVVLPIHHPIHVAEEWATLDQLSGGRVDFAAGRGYDQHEFTPFNTDFHSSAEQFSEGIELLPAGGCKGAEPMPNAWGGEGSGGPRGERNGRFTHGHHTREAKAIRKVIRARVREIKALLQATKPPTAT